MPVNIGVLLPRSTEYTAMGIDLLDGIRIAMKHLGKDYHIHIENTGFGEDGAVTNAAAEKLLLQYDVQLIICYATSLNAEALYPLAQNTNKPFLFIDAGMEIFEAPPHPLCRHITLQGLMACRLLAEEAAQTKKQAIMASSFLDGGYRSSWIFHEALAQAGVAIGGHFVSHYKHEEFTLAPLVELIEKPENDAVMAAFSSYLCAFFMIGIREAGPAAIRLPFYCSPFMADEQLLPSITFPGGEFHTVAPWSITLDTAANRLFVETVKKEKNKNANIFHLLGWEAAYAAERIIEESINALDDWSFESPRGVVHFDPHTHTTYAPLYKGKIEAGPEGNCFFNVKEKLEVMTEKHRELHAVRVEGQYSRWRNNFFCI